MAYNIKCSELRSKLSIAGVFYSKCPAIEITTITTTIPLP